MAFIFLDLEFNQVKSFDSNEILEVGAVKLNSLTLEVEGKFQSYVNNEDSPYVKRKILKIMKTDYSKIGSAD